MQITHIHYALKNQLLYWVWTRNLDNNTYKVHEVLSIFKYGWAVWRANGKLRNNEPGKSVILYIG